MKKNLWPIAALVLIVLVAGLALAVKFVAPGFFKTKIVKAVKEGCGDCVIDFKNVDISLARPGRLQFHDVRIAAGQGGRSMVEARLKTLTVDVSLMESSRERVVIKSVEGADVDVIYADGDAPKIESPEIKSEPPVPFAILSARLDRGRFRYVHTEDKRSSILHIHDISATLSAVGTTPELSARMATARLTGQIEKSGHAELVLAALLRPGPWYVDILLGLDDQNLADLNTFFTPNDGIELKGTMIKAVANLNIRDGKTKSRVEAIYKDAEFKERPAKERGALAAALATLGARLMMTKTNEDRPHDDRVTEIEVEREPDEPLVHYALRSAKLGLLDVAKKPDSRKKKMKTYSVYVLAALFLFAGVSHFLNPEPFLKIIPPFLPFPYAIAILSGVVELVLAAGLAGSRTRPLTAWATIVFLIAVFPANVYMYMIGETAFPQIPAWALLLRLPMQLVLIAWAYLFTASSKASGSGSSAS